MTFGTITINANFCIRCGKPFYYLGNIWNWGKGNAPYCECGEPKPMVPRQNAGADDRWIAKIKDKIDELRSDNEKYASSFPTKGMRNEFAAIVLESLLPEDKR